MKSKFVKRIISVVLVILTVFGISIVQTASASQPTVYYARNNSEGTSVHYYNNGGRKYVYCYEHQIELSGQGATYQYGSYVMKDQNLMNNIAAFCYTDEGYYNSTMKKNVRNGVYTENNAAFATQYIVWSLADPSKSGAAKGACADLYYKTSYTTDDINRVRAAAKKYTSNSNIKKAIDDACNDLINANKPIVFYDYYSNPITNIQLKWDVTKRKYVGKFWCYSDCIAPQDNGYNPMGWSVNTDELPSGVSVTASLYSNHKWVQYDIESNELSSIKDLKFWHQVRTKIWRSNGTYYWGPVGTGTWTLTETKGSSYQQLQEGCYYYYADKALKISTEKDGLVYIKKRSANINGTTQLSPEGFKIKVYQDVSNAIYTENKPLYLVSDSQGRFQPINAKGKITVPSDQYWFWLKPGTYKWEEVENTNEKGFAVSKEGVKFNILNNPPSGQFVVTSNSAPNPGNKNNPIVFDNSTTVGQINEEAEILKVNESGSTMDGVSFQLQKYNGTNKTWENVGAPKTTANGGIVSWVYRSADGGYTTASDSELQKGTKYRIKEVSTISGYTIDTETYDFTFTGKGFQYKWINRAKGRIQIRKIDSDTGAPVQGAVYRVKLLDEIEGYEAEQEFDLEPTDESGYAISPYLPASSTLNNGMGVRYKIFEVTAPEGYNKNLEESIVYLKASNNEINELKKNITSTSVTTSFFNDSYLNVIKPHILRIESSDENQTAKDVVLSGYEFTATDTAGNDITEEVFPYGNTTDALGQVAMFGTAPNQQIKVLPHFKNENGTNYTATTITYKPQGGGTTVFSSQSSSLQPKVVDENTVESVTEMKPQLVEKSYYGQLSSLRVGITKPANEPNLSLANWQVGIRYGNQVYVAKTNASGIATFRNVIRGLDYEIFLAYAPVYTDNTTTVASSYIQTNNLTVSVPKSGTLTRQYITIEKSVLAEGNYTNYLAEDTPNKLDIVKFKKTATGEMGDEPVANAIVAIYRKDETRPDLKGAMWGDYFVTDSTGSIFVSYIPAGSYVFEEVVQPDGYKRNKKIFEFDVAEDGGIKRYQEYDGTDTGNPVDATDDEIFFENEPTKVKLFKYDATAESLGLTDEQYNWVKTHYNFKYDSFDTSYTVGTETHSSKNVPVVREDVIKKDDVVVYKNKYPVTITEYVAADGSEGNYYFTYYDGEKFVKTSTNPISSELKLNTNQKTYGENNFVTKYYTYSSTLSVCGMSEEVIGKRNGNDVKEITCVWYSGTNNVTKKIYRYFNGTEYVNTQTRPTLDN